MNTTDSGEDPMLLDELVAIRPRQDDVFARSVRDSVRRSLVGTVNEPFRIGRFTVLEALGGGGMGTVFVAYDPDLDRKIALKVLHMRGERGRRDVLREGRALARLRHPNVVAVFDVGVVDDGVFVAMEYVAGHNLREWLRAPRDPETVLARLVEAGRGLAAAHAVELVHRDFKPENLVIDEGGHARVIDFGLARPLEELHEARAPVGDPAATNQTLRAGTPAYMAPERLAGAPGDPRSDQYAFCVTCWEALLGARPPDEQPGRRVPAWLRRALERGLSAEPARRWPSMTALLAALERGRTRARARTAAAVFAGVAVLAGGLAASRQWELARREAAHVEALAQHVGACEEAGAAVDTVWNDAARRHIVDAFTATNLRYAGTAAARLAPWLDRKALAWKRARTDACLRADPFVGGQWSPDTLDRAVLCLEDRLVTLEGLVDTFGKANATVVHKAVTIATTPDNIGECLDLARLQRRPAPPQDGREVLREVRAELARAAARGFTGDHAKALKMATAARERAERGLDWPPLWAAARALEAVSLEKTGAFKESEAASAEAYFAAARSQAWDIAAEAATKLVFTVGYKRAKHDEGRAWARHASVAIELAGDPDERLTAVLLSNLGSMNHSARVFAEARPQWERVLSIQERTLGPEHPQLAMTLNNLGNLEVESGRYTQARVLYERSLALKQKLLGPDHPDVAVSLNNLAGLHNAMGNPAEARALFQRALDVYEAARGPDHPDVAMALDNLAAILNTGGAPETALAMHRRALAIRERTLGPEHTDYAKSLNNLANVHRALKNYAEARALYERSLAIQEKALGPANLEIGKLLNNLALVHEATGAKEEARALYERALGVFEEALGREHPHVALSQYNLAHFHLEEGRPGDALPLLERAVTIVDAHPGVQPGEFELHLDLARALLGTRGDRARAVAEATKAREGFRDAGAGKAAELARAEDWLAAHDPTATPRRNRP